MTNQSFNTQVKRNHSFVSDISRSHLQGNHYRNFNSIDYSEHTPKKQNSLSKILLKEINPQANKKEHSRIKSSFERCHFLYEKGRIKNEVNKIISKKNHEMQVKSELNECTFKPKLNPRILKGSLPNQKVNQLHSTIYKRNEVRRKKAPSVNMVSNEQEKTSFVIYNLTL